MSNDGKGRFILTVLSGGAAIAAGLFILHRLLRTDLTRSASAADQALLLSALPCSKCTYCDEERITERVFFQSKKEQLLDMAVCCECDRVWHLHSTFLPSPLDVGNASATLPSIPPTATCVVITTLNGKAAAWINTNNNVRAVGIVDNQCKIDADLPPLPHVQRLLLMSNRRADSPYADRFAATFPNLLEMSACGTAFDGELASLRKCTKLQSLNFTGNNNEFTDAGLQHLTGLTTLQSLNLTNCRKVTDTGFQHLSLLTALRLLNLEGCCNITDDGLRHLSVLTALRQLTLHGCDKITDAGMRHLRGLTALQSLDLVSVQLKITGSGLRYLSGLTKLQSLNLKRIEFGTNWIGCAGLSDAGLQHLHGLTSLRSLILAGCNITDAGLQHLSGLTAMQTLDLAGCKISDDGLQILSGMTALQSLDLRNCKQITDTGLQHLRGFKSLRLLRLAGCELVTDAGLQHLRGLKSLQSLNLDAPNITDAGLQHLHGLTALRRLDVSFLISDSARGALQAAIPGIEVIGTTRLF